MLASVSRLLALVTLIVVSYAHATEPLRYEDVAKWIHLAEQGNVEVHAKLVAQPIDEVFRILLQNTPDGQSLALRFAKLFAHPPRRRQIASQR